LEIIVEVGTEQQKEFIIQELSVIKTLTEAFDLPKKISKLIVPADFDDTVNHLQNTNHYKSERGHLAFAKNIPQENGVAIVISPLLYTDEHEYHTRLQIYTHEFFHVVSKSLFPEIPQNSQADSIYYRNIYTLFDEYYANRNSYEVTEQICHDLSQRYKKYNAVNLKSFIKSVSGDGDFYTIICEEIRKFRFHADVETFLKKTDNAFDAAAKSFIYIYSYFDHNPKLKRLEPLLEQSPFFDARTKLLMKYFRDKYGEGNFELFGARKLVEDFMLNFGVKFEDMENGQLYCHVIDI
jgi:hypothetical protein